MKRRLLYLNLFIAQMVISALPTLYQLPQSLPMPEAAEAAVEINCPVKDAGQPEYEAGPEPELPPEEHIIEDFPLIWQLPELPTGCEVTALCMALRYWGYEADKTELAAYYLPTAEYTFSYGSEGLYGPDIYNYFLGDPFDDQGCACGAGAIFTAASGYLLAEGRGHFAHDMTGSAPEELYALAARDIPSVVFITIDLRERDIADGWYTQRGGYVDWGYNDHGAVLTGYTEDTVILADPLGGELEYSRERFEQVFEERGRQCVVIMGEEETAA